MTHFRVQQSGNASYHHTSSDQGYGVRFMTEISNRDRDTENECSTSENPLPRKKSPTPTSPPSKLGAEIAELDALLAVSTSSNSSSFQFNRTSDDPSSTSESYRSITLPPPMTSNRTSIADQFLAQFESRNNNNNNNNKASTTSAPPKSLLSNSSTTTSERLPRDSALNSIDLNNNNLTNVSSLVIQDMTTASTTQVHAKSKQPSQQLQLQQQQQSIVEEEERNATFNVVVTTTDKTKSYCERIMMDAARQMTNEFERNYLEYQKSQQTLLNEEKSKHHAEIVKLQRDMKLMYERMKMCELKSDKKDAEIRNLETLLQLQQNRSRAQISFLKWRLKATKASSETLANRMAILSHESRLKTRVLLAWQKKMSKAREARAEKSIRKKAQDALQSLANTYETKLKKYQEEFERKENEFKRFKRDRLQRDEKLRGLITRYLVNLNQEALSMFDQTDHQMYQSSSSPPGQKSSTTSHSAAALSPSRSEFNNRQPLSADEFAALYHHFQSEAFSSSSSSSATSGQSSSGRKTSSKQPHRDKDPHHSEDTDEEASVRRKTAAVVQKPASTSGGVQADRRSGQQSATKTAADQHKQNKPITVTPLLSSSSSSLLEGCSKESDSRTTHKITNQLPPSGYQQSQQASSGRQNPASAITNITKNFANVNVSTLKNNSQLVQERSIFVQKHTS